MSDESDPQPADLQNGDVRPQCDHHTKPRENQVEPDPYKGQFRAFYDIYAPRLDQYIKSLTRYARLNPAEAENVFQEAWRELAAVLRNPKRRIESPRAFLFVTAANDFKNRLEQFKQSPHQLADHASIPNSNNQSPAEREELVETERRRTELREWIDRFVPLLNEVCRECARISQIKVGMSTAGQSQLPPPRRSRRTKANKALRIP